MVTNAIPSTMTEVLFLIIVLWSHSLDFISDKDVIADIIAHWLNFISIEALMHV